MPSWPSPEPATCAKLTAHVAQILDESGVGSIAWGHQPISLFQYDKLGEMKIQELVFVINDRQIQDAINALENVAGFPVCTKPNCIELEEQRMLYVDKVLREHGGRRLNLAHGLNATERQHCVGVAHFHRGPDSDPDAVFNQDCEDTFGRLFGRGSHVVITLMRQGEMMPWLSELKPGPPAADDPHLTTSHDSRFPVREVGGPSGPWSEYHAVQMLNRESFVESLIWLLCRDLHRLAYNMWFPMVYSLNSRDKEGSIKLQSEFGPVWDDLLTGEPLLGTARLRERLIAEGRLPKDLPHIPTDDRFDPFPEVKQAKERDPVIGLALEALIHLLAKGASP